LWPGRKSGALITRIGAASPAERAGLKTGDIIIRFAGRRVRNAEQLRKLADAAHAGTDARIDVLRDGRMQCLNVTMAKPPSASLPADQ
jgi:serine protease Do